jgi:hypothetical protein
MGFLTKVRRKVLGFDPSALIQEIAEIKRRSILIDERLLDLSPFIVEADDLCKRIDSSIDSRLELAKAEIAAERETIDVLQELISRDLRFLRMQINEHSSE